MATSAIAVRVKAERRFFTGMAVAMLLFVFLGFAPTYFLAPLLELELARPPHLSPLVHLHAAVASAWMVFLVLQTGLIMGQQHASHMRNGLIGAALAAALVLIGFAVAITAAQSGRNPPGWTPSEFLIIPLVNLVLFAGFVAAALSFRGRVDIHKRLMLIATIAILVPAGSRFARYYLAPVVPGGPVGGMILSDLFLAALAIHDVRTRGRLHPATIWGGSILLFSQPLRLLIGETAIWNRFAELLIG